MTAAKITITEKKGAFSMRILEVVALKRVAMSLTQRRNITEAAGQGYQYMVFSFNPVNKQMIIQGFHADIVSALKSRINVERVFKEKESTHLVFVSSIQKLYK